MALLALRREWTGALGVVWLFNIVGTLDLVNAVTRGVLNGAAAGMGAAFWIPAIVVPALLVSHALVFRVLVRERATGARPYPLAT